MNCLESCRSDSSALGVLLQSSLSLKENSIIFDIRRTTQMPSEEKDVFSLKCCCGVFVFFNCCG